MFESIVIGNVGTVRFVNSGKTQVLNFSLAASRKVGDTEYTDWASVKVWGDRAERLKEHIAKGMKLLVRGRPEAKGYKREDGTVGGEMILHANEIEFLSPKSRQEDGDSTQTENTATSELPLDSADAGTATGKTQRRRN
jgi:single-strand DNA-binding protein